MPYMKRALQSRDPRFAEILRKLGHAPEAEAVEEDKAEKPKKAAKKRAYKRRDMQAEEE